MKPGRDTTVFCYSAEFTGPASNRNNLAIRAVDLGGKGACLLTVGRLREKLPVIVEITLPEDQARFRARAVVVWSQTLIHKSQEANVAGLEFTEILEASGEKVQFMAEGCRRPRQAATGQDLRREHRKTLLQQSELVCRQKGFWSALGFSSVIKARLEDLQPEGFRMDCGVRLAPGRRLETRLDFHTPRTFVAAEVLVISCQRDTLVLEPHYKVEVSFTNILPENRQRLEEILCLLRPHSSEGPSAP